MAAGEQRPGQQQPQQLLQQLPWGLLWPCQQLLWHLQGTGLVGLGGLQTPVKVSLPKLALVHHSHVASLAARSRLLVLWNR